MTKKLLAVVLFCTAISLKINGQVTAPDALPEGFSLVDFLNVETRLKENIILIDSQLVVSLKKEFDKCDRETNNASAFGKKVNMAKGMYQDMFNSAFLANSPAQDKILAHLHNELDEYKTSVVAFINQSERLVNRISSATEIGIFTNNLLNVNLTRSLLFAAMGNLERYYSLGYKVKNIQEVDSLIKSTADITKQNTDSISDTTSMVYATSIHTDTLLNEHFTPYKPLGKKNTAAIEKPSDKITMAANTILIDNRRNWWWRTLIGGVVGGLIAGLIVVAAK